MTSACQFYWKSAAKVLLIAKTQTELDPIRCNLTQYDTILLNCDAIFFTNISHSMGWQ